MGARPACRWRGVAQQIQYCTTPDKVRIAYAMTGKGSPIVRASPWLSHLEYDLQSPVFRNLVAGMAERHTYLRYDARGTGLSDREVAEISFDAFVRDLECVVDAAKLERFALFGISQGAPISIAYAVRHPERVSHLILYGGFARGPLQGDDRKKGRELFEIGRTMIRAGWGSQEAAYRQWFTSLFIPDGTAEQASWFNELEAISASPEMAERSLVATADINVSALLPQVQAPTLVLHCRGDLRAPFAMGQELAGGIPGARFVPLESTNHLFLAHEPAYRTFFETLAPFLGDPPIRGRIPGLPRKERLQTAVHKVEGSWPYRLIIIVAAIAGLVGVLLTLL